MSDKEKVSGEEVVRYEAVHLRYDENNIRYGEGCEVEVVTAADFDRITEALRGEVERSNALYVAQWERTCKACDERDQLRAEVERLKDALDIESHRLAACGVAALGYFDGCAEEYHSASLHDVLALRAQLAQHQVPGW